jgi:hypothetical protein
MPIKKVRIRKMIITPKDREKVTRVIGALEGIAVLAENSAVSDMLFDIAHKLEAVLEPTEE